MFFIVTPIFKKQPQVILKPLDRMIQMLLPNFGVGVLTSFVYLILGTIFIQCNVSFKSPFWRFLCNFKYVCVCVGFVVFATTSMKSCKEEKEKEKHQ